MNQLNRSLFVALAVLVGLAIAVPSSYAGQILYQTGFENKDTTFLPGTSLVGQDGWIGVANPDISLSPGAAVISNDKPLVEKQSLLVPGAALAHQDAINSETNGYYDAIGSYRRPVESGNPPQGYDATGQTVRVSALVQVDGPRTGHNDNFFSASIAAIAGIPADGSAFGVGELAISSDGQVHAYSGDDPVPTFFTSAPVSLGRPHSLAVEANFASRTTSFFVDDEFLGSFPFANSATPNIFRRGSMVTYAAPNTAARQKADYSARFDQFKIDVVDPQ
jgi:hypothetical protein